MLNEEKDWDEISHTFGLSEEFIRENADKLDWGLTSSFQKLSEDFIREFSDKVDWNYVSASQKLSEDFIREFSDKVDWYNISVYQKLSEGFIKEFSYKVDWACISVCQKLSEKFIRENLKQLNFDYISWYQKLSPEYIKEYNLEISENFWLYKDKEFKREYIKNNTEYDIIGDKVIAYKSCRSDGYSLYNFQYHYEVGGEYECHANSDTEYEDSFGLSAWTKVGALACYSKGKLLKVEIDLDDIACITLIDKKIRASKIKILEEISF